MKNVESKEKNDFWKSTKLSNIIAIISCIVTILGVIISFFSLYKSNKAMQIVQNTVEQTTENNVEVERVTTMQNGNQIINGISVEDADYVSKDNDNEMMDKAYGAEDILKLVDENPNLSFCLLWRGSQEEYEATDWDKMPPNIKIERWDDNTSTFYMDYH